LECGYSIHDINGKQIKSGCLTMDTNRINISNLSEGIYWLRLSAESHNPIMFIKNN